MVLRRDKQEVTNDWPDNDINLRYKNLMSFSGESLTKKFYWSPQEFEYEKKKFVVLQLYLNINNIDADHKKL